MFVASVINICQSQWSDINGGFDFYQTFLINPSEYSKYRYSVGLRNSM